MRRSRTKKHRANESALKMLADRRDCKVCFQIRLGEWAFSLERLSDGFRRCISELVPRTDSKGVLWKAFAYFRPFTKVSACPGMRGKPAPAETPRGGTRSQLALENAAKPHQKTASQRERSENARRQTRMQGLFPNKARRVGIFIGAPYG